MNDLEIDEETGRFYPFEPLTFIFLLPLSLIAAWWWSATIKK